MIAPYHHITVLQIISPVYEQVIVERITSDPDTARKLYQRLKEEFIDTPDEDDLIYTLSHDIQHYDL